MRIAVLGGGNGSFAAAADMALAGHDVRMWRRSSGAAREHEAAGRRILIKDARGQREAVVSLVTSDIAQAIGNAELILCLTPATAHDDIATVLAPHLEPGQVIFLPPGTLGTLVFAKAAQAAGTVKGVSFAETGTLPWLARKHGPYEVAVTTRAVRLPTGVFPLTDADHALAVIGEAFPGVIEPCGDVLSAALMNAGPIIHPPVITMNAGPLEHFERWDIHNEGTQPSTRRVTDSLDQERIAIREALGYQAPHFPLADHYRDDGDEWMYARHGHADLTSSGDWREKIDLTAHRYMLEDVRLGLSLMVSIANLAGVDAPLARSFLAIGQTICATDFMAEGRTLSRLGLSDLSRAQLQQFLHAGFA